MGGKRTGDLQERSQHVSRLRAVLERDGNTVVLTDLDTVGYLHGVHDIAVIKATREGPSCNRVYMYDPAGAAEQLVVDFVNSESAKTCDGIRRVKKILRSFGGRPKKERGHNGERR